MADTLRASGISQRFGGRVVLDRVDLEVPAGKVIGLLGPNGAGKTTLMRILFGVLAPDAGTVEWQGRPATDADRRSWGYMPQERGLYRDMRVLDQLTWIGRLHGLDKATGERRATELLERLGLGERGRDKVQDLSGGMAQRVQLAAAMVHEPDVLVLDEPFSGLDPVAVEFLSDVIGHHVHAGRILLFSSHQLDLVEDLCETITLINHGRVVLQGDVRQLKADSRERYLRVDVTVDDTWVDTTKASVVTRDASGTRLRLEPGADPGAVLDAVRARVAVQDFGVEAPSLSELFLAVAGEPVAGTPHADTPGAGSVPAAAGERRTGDEPGSAAAPGVSSVPAAAGERRTGDEPGSAAAPGVSSVRAAAGERRTGDEPGSAAAPVAPPPGDSAAPGGVGTPAAGPST